jgi:hypothetical protein
MSARISNGVEIRSLSLRIGTVLVAALCVCLLVSACSNGSTSQTLQPTPNMTAPASPNLIYGSLRSGGCYLTDKRKGLQAQVHSVVFGPDDLSPGTTYLWIDAGEMNKAKQPHMASNGDFELESKTGTTILPAYGDKPTGAHGTTFNPVTLRRRQHDEGWINFQMPTGASTYQVQWTSDGSAFTPVATIRIGSGNSASLSCL